jgi:hypothetical protein
MVTVWSEVQRKVTEVFTRTTLADLREQPPRAVVVSSSLSSAA